MQHLMYAKFVATLVPAWIPGQLFWAYFVGVAFFAAGLSIIARKLAPLAATLLGLMFLLWVILLHLPRVVASPHDGKEWTSAFVALAMSGSAFALAGALARRE
jgi:sorbitol-specific phosphotransferase system component IIBC